MMRAIVLALLLAPGIAIADRTLDQYKQLKQAGRDVVLDNWVDGLVSGLTWAQADAKYRGQRAMFCQPDRFVISPAIARGMIESYLSRDTPFRGKPDEDIYLGAVLLYALKDAFPCP